MISSEENEQRIRSPYTYQVKSLFFCSSANLPQNCAPPHLPCLLASSLVTSHDLVLPDPRLALTRVDPRDTAAPGVDPDALKALRLVLVSDCPIAVAGEGPTALFSHACECNWLRLSKRLGPDLLGRKGRGCARRPPRSDVECADRLGLATAPTAVGSLPVDVVEAATAATASAAVYGVRQDVRWQQACGAASGVYANDPAVAASGISTLQENLITLENVHLVSLGSAVVLDGPLQPRTCWPLELHLAVAPTSSSSSSSSANATATALRGRGLELLNTHLGLNGNALRHHCLDHCRDHDAVPRRHDDLDLRHALCLALEPTVLATGKVHTEAVVLRPAVLHAVNVAQGVAGLLLEKEEVLHKLLPFWLCNVDAISPRWDPGGNGPAPAPA
mmetsp:Transcript_12436/g.25417  ORF Transcript_12436/g.25417 Transcript_12436/m.25417 type:complete len:390 (-) Transcript_12436:1278-2447(-)